MCGAEWKDGPGLCQRRSGEEAAARGACARTKSKPLPQNSTRSYTLLKNRKHFSYKSVACSVGGISPTLRTECSAPCNGIEKEFFADNLLVQIYSIIEKM
jgi:hypothetical protein